MTLEEAKELSAKKWELLVKYDGNEARVLKDLPILTNFRQKCAMCEYIWEESGLRCGNCLYDGLCISDTYGAFLEKACSSTATEMYNKILKRNKL